MKNKQFGKRIGSIFSDNIKNAFDFATQKRTGKMSQLDKPAITEVNAAKEILKKAGYIACFWHTSDIVEKALADGIELSEENIQQIRESIEARHDANDGINWNIISAYIDMVKNS